MKASLKGLLVWVCLGAAFGAGAAEKIRVACIGDSITFGYGLPNRAEESYPAQLQKLLDVTSPGKYEVRNFGNSGRGIYLDSMRGAERRGFRWMAEHKAALAYRPNVVICNLGINDNGEYIKEYTGARARGQFVKDYVTLLGDYAAQATKPRLLIWTKLSPLAPGQRFYRSPEPFLMQADLLEVARRTGATGLDMQEPLREVMDSVLAKDKIHPNADGARRIAETTATALLAPKGSQKNGSRRGLDALPKGGPREIWLCAGQSNMQQGWGFYNRTPEEKARVKAELAQLTGVDVRFWDFNDGSWKRLTPANCLEKCALGVSFAIRRARQTRKQICLLYLAAGGAPTEAFLSEQVMCAVGPDGRPKYPNLCRIATNRHRLDANDDFPCLWCKREYPRRRGKAVEAGWWPVSRLYDNGVKAVFDAELPLTGIIWYQGESNATTNVSPDVPLAEDYMLETNRAIVEQLRGKRKIPFVMMGLPKMNRPWEPYRAAQRKACEETGAIFIDSFGAGLGDSRDVHPRNKIPFAELILSALRVSKR